MSIIKTRLRSTLLALTFDSYHTMVSLSRFYWNLFEPETSVPSFQSLNMNITHLIRNGRIDDARQVFDRTRVRNVVTWNSMLSGYVRRREIAKARKLFDEMPDRDVVSWNLMISAYMSCHRVRDVEEARKLFDEMPVRDSVSFNTMISGYAKNGDMSEASKIFNSMPERDLVSWNAVITGFLQNGDSAAAVRVFEEMPERGGHSFWAVVSGLVRNREFREAERVLLEFGGDRRDGLDLVEAYNSLIAGYGQWGRVEDARRVFDRFEKNVISWNSMIMCYLRARDVVSARKVFDEMKERDTVSWNTMINGYVHVLDMDEALRLFAEMPNPDPLTWNSMISGFARVRKLYMARGLFEKMPGKNLVSWNSIISGHEKNEDYHGSIDLFSRMRRKGLRPDCHTLSSILSSSTFLVDLYLGRQVHQLAIKTVASDVVVSNSIVTMYSRCGPIKEARLAFNEIGRDKKDAISWNAMIGGYAAHGFAVEALECFEAMKSTKTRPNRVTFISVLSACANAGFVEEGQRQFESMGREFGIEPNIEHYASLVCLFGRSGQFERAMDLIETMPIAPDGSIWGALLGACRVHNNVGLAKLAAEALSKIEPESSGHYVLLYNIYADLGLWDEAESVRVVMEHKNVVKELGYSRL